MGKTLLVGNGINIEFGGFDFLNKWILARLLAKAKRGGYDNLFRKSSDVSPLINGDTIVQIFNGFIDIANRILENYYDEKTREEPELQAAVIDFKQRYDEKFAYPDQIGLEDWFLLLRLFFVDNPDVFSEYVNAQQGFKNMIIDAIYSDAHLQKVYHTMLSVKGLKGYFCSFDELFTLNYDNNLEALTGKPAFHLHGDFSIKVESEHPETVWGSIRNANGTAVWQPDDFLHCFCNALLAYSGEQKYEIAKQYSELNSLLENIIRLSFDNPKLCKSEIAKWKELCKLQSAPLGMENVLEEKIKNPHLLGWSDYHFIEFEKITGEIQIIGISPQNDSHIFRCIAEGIEHGRIDKVVYYYLTEKERDKFPLKFDCIETKPVKELWDTFYRQTKNPEKIKQKKHIRNIPVYTANCLYEMLETELENPQYHSSPKSEKELLGYFRQFCRTITLDAISPADMLATYFDIKSKKSEKSK